MRILLGLGVLGLGVSAWFAPAHYRARPPEPLREGLVEPDPRRRVEEGEALRSLGLALGGYEQLYREHPDDPGTLKGLFRTGQLLGAAAFGTPGLDQVVAEVAQAYLRRRAELDPDGAFLRGVAAEWIAVRRQHNHWLGRASIAIFSAAVGDPEGREALLAFPERAFHEVFFPFALRFLPAWPAVEARARQDLAQSRLMARVLAGAAVLFYHELYGVGGDLLERFGPEIRSAFLEAKTGLAPSAKGPDTYGWSLLGLAMLGGPEERAILEGMRLLDYPRVVDALKVARLTMGIDPFSKYSFRGEQWEVLWDSRELVFRAAAFRYARLARERGDPDALAEARAVVESGLYHRDELIRVLCFRALAAVEPDSSAAIIEEKTAEVGLVPLFAAFHVEPERRLPLVLPFLGAGDPGLAAIAAVALRDPEGPSPIQLPTR